MASKQSSDPAKQRSCHHVLSEYQRHSNRTYLEMIATHRCSPSKMGGSYYAVVLTSEYAIPISYIRKTFSAGLNGLQVD